MVFSASSQVIIISPILPRIAEALVVQESLLGTLVTSYAVMLGIPFLVFLSRIILAPAADRLFPGMSSGSLLAFLVFVMPIAETLFFRGLLQGQLAFWLVGLLATVWNIVLFFPVMWAAVTELPAVTAVIVILLLMMNLLYVYVRKRNGLAAAWICQIVANLIILYVPFLQ